MVIVIPPVHLNMFLTRFCHKKIAKVVHGDSKYLGTNGWQIRDDEKSHVVLHLCGVSHGFTGNRPWEIPLLSVVHVLDHVTLGQYKNVGR